MNLFWDVETGGTSIQILVSLGENPKPASKAKPLIIFRGVLFSLVAGSKETKKRVRQSEAAHWELRAYVHPVQLGLYTSSPSSRFWIWWFRCPPPCTSPSIRFPTNIRTAAVEPLHPRNWDRTKRQSPFHLVIPATSWVTKHLRWHLLPGHMCAQTTFLLSGALCVSAPPLNSDAVLSAAEGTLNDTWISSIPE